MNGWAKDTLRQTTRLAEHASESAGASRAWGSAGGICVDPSIPADPAVQRTLDAPAARFILPAGALSRGWFQPKLVVLGQIDRLLAELGQVLQAGLPGQIEIRRRRLWPLDFAQT